MKVFRSLALAAVLAMGATCGSAQSSKAGFDAYYAGDYQTAVKEFRPLAEQGDRLAQKQLAEMYWRGKGVPENYVEAARLFRLSADQGDIEAQFSLGRLYRASSGGVPNHIAAFSWYRLVAGRQGEIMEKSEPRKAQRELCASYWSGYGVPQNYVRAHTWCNIAAANSEGNDVQYQRADLKILEKNMTPEDISKGQHLATTCMNSGYKNCGDMDIRTKITFDDATPEEVDSNRILDEQNAQNFDKAVAAYDSGDYQSALNLWLPVAEHGDESAQYNLGLIFEFGKGVSVNYADAAKWYRLSAVQGNVDAQFRLGLMYANGYGVPQNSLRAHMWYNLSYARGYKANASLARSYLADKLTRLDVSNAQEMAVECFTSGYKNCGEP